MRRPLSLIVFSAIITLFNLVLYNIPVLQFAAEHAELDFLPKTFLMSSLVVILVSLTFMLTYLIMFSSRWVGRTIIAILQTINALAIYFIITYHVILDGSMMGNVFNTRYSEASGFFSWQMVVFVVLFGILPSAFAIFWPIKKEKRKPKRLAAICGGSLGLSVLLILVNINQTLWIGRYDTELGGLIMPWSYLVNTCRVISQNHDKNVEEIKLPDGKITDDRKTAVVLVIGESARKANFQLYGYKRATNPLLSKQPELKVIQANSCATYTTAGTRSILEPQDGGDLHEILPNYAYRTGVDVQWRTSNWGEPPVHIKEYIGMKELSQQYPDFKDKDYDGLLFNGLRERIEKSNKSKVLIILHTSTSHGPVYSKKYPKEFEKFSPVIDNVEQADKEIDKLINAYDNSVIYTDYLLSNLIDTLRSMSDWQTAMLFVSDHGESLGEKNLFMHGVPMSMAPAYQYEIPFFVWTSPNFRTLKKQGKELPDPLDQHYVFHSVLDLLSIQSPAYKPEFDIFQK